MQKYEIQQRQPGQVCGVINISEVAYLSFVFHHLVYEWSFARDKYATWHVIRLFHIFTLHNLPNVCRWSGFGKDVRIPQKILFGGAFVPQNIFARSVPSPSQIFFARSVPPLLKTLLRGLFLLHCCCCCFLLLALLLLLTNFIIFFYLLFFASTTILLLLLLIYYYCCCCWCYFAVTAAAVAILLLLLLFCCCRHSFWLLLLYYYFASDSNFYYCYYFAVAIISCYYKTRSCN